MQRHINSTWAINFSKVLPIAIGIGKVVAAIAMLIITFTSTAQPGALDPTFNPGSGANAGITALAIQADGKVLLGGAFTSFNGTACGKIIRLMPDGKVDTTFKIGAGVQEIFATVYAIETQQDGKILVGGSFDTISGYPLRRLARFHADGRLDTSFHIGTGFNDNVAAIAIQPDDRILVGGDFTEYKGFSANRIIRLMPDGSPDPAWDRTYGADGPVGKIALQPDGRIMIGGDFVTYGGVGNTFLSFRVTRAFADGTRDLGFQAIPGPSRAVSDIAIQPDGKYILVGNFIQYDFQPRGRVIRLFPNGQRSFGPGDGVGANGSVSNVELFNNGNVLLAGGFSEYNGVPAGCIIMLDTDGFIDTTFKYGMGANDGIMEMLLQQDEKVIIAGHFTTYDGQSTPRVARLFTCRTPMPDSINGPSIINCPGSEAVFHASPVAGADSYEWVLPNGWTGSSDSASISVISNGQPGTISVRAFSNRCGFSYTQAKSISNSSIPALSICLVTVDSASTHNIIVWEKQHTGLIDSFCIYRETTSNTYTKIASVPFDSLSEYHDYDANPNVTSYRYKLSTIDTCGVESLLSPFHRTIHLQNLANGNFQWTFYQIEGQSNPVMSFNFYRDAFNNGNFFQIGNIPGTNATYTDITYSSFPDANYVVDADWSIACTPSRGPINTTRSNIRKDKTGIELIGIMEADAAKLEVFPNPSSGILFLRSTLTMHSVNFINALGQNVLQENSSANDYAINTTALPSGVYMVQVKTDLGEKKVRVMVR